MILTGNPILYSGTHTSTGKVLKEIVFNEIIIQISMIVYLGRYKSLLWKTFIILFSMVIMIKYVIIFREVDFGWNSDEKSIFV